MTRKEDISVWVEDTLLMCPFPFVVTDRKGKKHEMSFYPKTIGKMILTSRILKQMDGIKGSALSIVKKEKRSCAKIVALYTCRTKEEHFDEELINERTDLFAQIDNVELASLLAYVLSDRIDEAIKHYGLDEESKIMADIKKLKESDNTRVFGGKSIFGTLIGHFQEKCGWSTEHIVWEEPYAVLRMCMADAVTSVYLSDKEKKNVPTIEREGTKMKFSDFMEKMHMMR